MLWSVSFLSHLGKRPRSARGTRSRDKRRPPCSRPVVEELEPRVLLSGGRLHLPPDAAGSAHVRVVAPARRAVPSGLRLLRTPGHAGQMVRTEFTATFS